MKKFQILFRLFFRHQLTSGRMFLIGGFSVLLIVITLATASSSEGPDRVSVTLDVLSVLGLGLSVPIVALVLASSTLGDLVEDETLVYLWHRPSPRWQIAWSAWTAAVAITLPATSIPLGLAGWLGAGSLKVGLAIALASGVASIAYCGLFSFAGVIVKKSVLWGLLYIFIWEGLLSGLFPGLSRLSIHSYATDLAIRVSEAQPVNGLHSVTASILACSLFAIGFVVLTTWRLNRMDVA